MGDMDFKMAGTKKGITALQVRMVHFYVTGFPSSKSETKTISGENQSRWVFSLGEWIPIQKHGAILSNPSTKPVTIFTYVNECRLWKIK